MDKEFLEKFLLGFDSESAGLSALKTILENTNCRHTWTEMKYEEARLEKDKSLNMVSSGFHYQKCKECNLVKKVK